MSSFASALTHSAQEGQNLATQTTKSMDEINEQVTAISESISVIDQIAFQTNILSLNTKQPGFFNEKHSRERFYKIADALRDKGLNVGEMEGKSEHIEEFYDIENIIDKNGTGISKELLEKKGLIKKETKQNN